MDHGRHSKRQEPYGGGSSVETGGGGGSDRLLQWSVQETRDLLMIRAELDPAFMDTKRNKLLWEMVSTRMKEMGYNRSPDQCKCKWKNLVTRYKGCETMDTERMRQQFPYYNEMQTIFTARMQRMLWLESEGGGVGSSQKAVGQFSSGDDEENNIDGLNETEKGATRKKRKAKVTTQSAGRISNASSFNAGEFREMMEGYMRQQVEMEMQWMKVYEERENRRREREIEWRQRMESLEKERISMERRWREKEQERRIREDERAEKREGLLTALLNKLRRDDM